MAFKYVRSENLGTIAAGASKDTSITFSEDVVIHKIMLNERTGTGLEAAQVYIEIAGNAITRDFAPAYLFDVDGRNVPVMDMPLGRGGKIYVKVANSGSSDINVDVVVEVHSA